MSMNFFFLRVYHFWCNIFFLFLFFKKNCLDDEFSINISECGIHIGTVKANCLLMGGVGK